MATDQPLVHDDTDDFLDYLLRCALSAPGAATSPTAGRILARLLVVGAVEGGDDLITPYLVPRPGEGASFEVRSYQPGDLVPTDVREGLLAAAALKIALRSARETDDGIEVVSRGDSGLERCVLVRDSTGDFEFRFAGPETLVGDTADCADAKAGWESVIASWRGAVAPTADDARWRLPVTAATPATPTATARRSTPSATAGSVSRGGWWVPGGSEDGGEAATPAAVAGGEGDVQVPTGAEPAGREASAAVLDEAAAGVDAPPVDEPTPVDGVAVGDAVLAGENREGADVPPAAITVAAPGDEGASLAGVPAAPPAPFPTSAVADALAGRGAPPVGSAVGQAEDPLAAAIRDAIANLVVEVDLSQVEQLIRKVLEDDHREMVEPLARRLSARLGENLQRNDAQSMLAALVQVIPTPADLAETVAADVGALLSETVLRRRAGDGVGGLDAINLVAGIEQLQVRLDGIHAQLQKTADLMQVIGEHVDSGDRRAAIAERVATSVDHEMQRLANRIDEQVAALVTSTGNSDMADSVARLTRKLRQSVTQLDRVLERMDKVAEQAPEEPEKPEVPEDVVPFRRPLGMPLRAGEPLPGRRTPRPYGAPPGPPGRR